MLIYNRLHLYYNMETTAKIHITGYDDPQAVMVEYEYDTPRSIKITSITKGGKEIYPNGLWYAYDAVWEHEIQKQKQALEDLAAKYQRFPENIYIHESIRKTQTSC